MRTIGRGLTAIAAGVLTTGVVLLSALAPAAAADDTLITAAKKEGSVTWYTTLIVDQLARPIADAFQKKYGITVNYIRSGSPEIYLRLFNEGKAGRVQGDLFDGTAGAGELKKEGLLLQWVPDIVRSWPAQDQDPDGYWTPMSPYVFEPGVNTTMVSKGDEPKTYEDLLDPKWKDKLSWNLEPSTTGAAGFIGEVLTSMGGEKGMDYLRQLAKQNIAGVQGGARHLFDMVIAGEYPMALQMLNHHAFFSANQGAPAGWVRLQPAMVAFLVLNLTKGGPHPNAAKLLADFIVSDEGQAIFRDVGYNPASPAVEPRDPSLRPDGVKFRATYFTPQQIDASLPKWNGIYTKLFR